MDVCNLLARARLTLGTSCANTSTHLFNKTPDRQEQNDAAETSTHGRTHYEARGREDEAEESHAEEEEIDGPSFNCVGIGIHAQ